MYEDHHGEERQFITDHQYEDHWYNDHQDAWAEEEECVVQREQTPLVPAVPAGHSSQTVWIAFGSDPSAHVAQLILSSVNIP